MESGELGPIAGVEVLEHLLYGRLVGRRSLADGVDIKRPEVELAGTDKTLNGLNWPACYVDVNRVDGAKDQVHQTTVLDFIGCRVENAAVDAKDKQFTARAHMEAFEILGQHARSRLGLLVRLGSILDEGDLTISPNAGGEEPGIFSTRLEDDLSA